MQHYVFVVQAVDRGQPPLSSTVTVYFNVQDLNDNAPIFDPMSYSDEVYENVTVGSTVLTVSATDQDGGNECLVLIWSHIFCTLALKNPIVMQSRTSREETGTQQVVDFCRLKIRMADVTRGFGS